MKITPALLSLKRFQHRAIFCVSLVVGVAMSPVGSRAQSASVVEPAPASSSSTALTLVPMPREVHPQGELSLAHGIDISTADHNDEDKFAAIDLVDSLKSLGIDAREGDKGRVKIVLLRLDRKKTAPILARAHVAFDPPMHDEGYILLSEGDTTYDIAATGAGLFYGAQTLKQLISVNRGKGRYGAILHRALIRDWPAMKYRGLDDDLSRGPMPTLEFQKHQVRVLSAYKVNIYSPYFENTLAYASNPLPAPPGGGMSREQVEELVNYAKQYHVTIIPEQEVFGHLHHVLTFDTYSDLAETPHGSVLAPGQSGSLQLIQTWFTEIASMFPGPFLHIGADETFELGSGQTKALAQKEGLGKVYIDFLTQIYKALQPLHKRILFWGDIAMKNPELVATLPKDMIAVAWEYNPQPEGYDKWLRPFVDAGLETWVAPGVNNWNRVYPDNNMALANIQGFVRDGHRLGSTGVLNTVWNDDGEGLFNQDWYGVLFGAAAAWQPRSSSIPQFQNSFGQVFHGDATGKINQAQIALMEALKTLTDTKISSSSDALFWMDPWSPEGQQVSAKLLPVVHSIRLQAEKAIILLAQARAAGPLRENDALDAMELGARRLDFLGYKFEAAQEIVLGYRRAYQNQSDPKMAAQVARELWDISDINGRCQDIRDGYGLTRDLYRKAWLRENRPYWLDNISAHYDLEMQRWIRRGVRFHAAQSQWFQTHTLPSPQELGLPQLSFTADKGSGDKAN